MKIKFIGGPMNGEVQEESDPAPLIFPKGTPLDAIWEFLEEEGNPINCGCYKLTHILNSSKKVYIWHE